jgi:hypothetical protein
MQLKEGQANSYKKVGVDMYRWYRKMQWRLSLLWYRVKLWLGWWYCEHCEKMHSPFTAKYDFNNSEEYECCKGVYDLPVLKAYENDSEYFYELTKKLYKVG